MSPDTRPALPRLYARGSENGNVTLARPPAGTIPDTPGSYQLKDRDGRVTYVGKAKSLRARLSNYFGNPVLLPPRPAQMVGPAETVARRHVRSDGEALMRGASLV